MTNRPCITALRPLSRLVLAVALLTAGPMVFAGDLADDDHPMPEFSIRDLDGRVIDSQELKGKVVLLDIWATWCGSCRTAAPRLDRIHANLRSRGLEMVGIAVDSGTAEDVRKVVRSWGMTYPQVIWNQHLAERIQGLKAVPTYILVAPDWTIRKLWVGMASTAEIRREIEKLLVAPADEPKSP